MTPALMPGVASVVSAAAQLPPPEFACKDRMPRDCVQAVFLPAANDDACYAEARAGQTVAEILGAQAAYSLRVSIGGIEVPRAIWTRVRPKAGQRVHIEFWPQGGGARKWILTIVAVVATVFTAGAAAGASWALVGGLSATTVMVGGALIASLALAMIPPPMPKMGAGAASDPLSQIQSLTGTSNQANPYGVIPLVIGSTRMFPPHAAMPYTEISGNDQYLRMLLDFGYGDLDVSDIQIGGTPIDQYEDVDYEITTTPTLFTQDVNELSVTSALNTTGDTATRTTQTATTEISLDLVGPQGVYGVDANGGSVTGTIGFSIQYRATGSTGAWTPIGSATGLTMTAGLASAGGAAINLTSGARQAYRGGVRWKVPSGQYDVTVTRTTAKGIGFPGSVDINSVSDQMTWSVLRSISPQNPSKTGTLKLAVRIKATDQLNGVVSTLSANVAQKIRRWDAGTGTWLAPVATLNPAWIYLWLMTECPGTTVHALDSQMDIGGIADWAAACETAGYVYGGVADSARVMSDLLKDVLACGLGTFGMRNGKYSVVRDIAQTVSMQVYTPINGGSVNWTRNYSPAPHALRVSFTNPQQNGQQDELIVYWDGYNADGSGGLTAATRFEKLDLRNVTDPNAAWRIARYHLAVMWLRPCTYQITTDFEHLINDRGDLVEVAGPLIGWGVAYGRVKAVNGNVLTLTEPLETEAGKTYAIRVRLGTAFSSVSNITVDPANPANVTLATPIGNAAVGQLYVVGEVNKVSADMLITGIEAAGGMLQRKATLTLVDAAPGVWTANTGTPPPFVSSINGTPWCAPPDPPTVNIRVGDSAPDDAGVIRPRPGFSSGPGSGIYRAVPIYGGGGGVGAHRIAML